MFTKPCLYNIICHDFFSNKNGSYVKSDNAHTMIQHTPLSPYIRHLHLDFQWLCPFHSLSRQNHVMASYPSPGDKTTRAREGSPKLDGTNQKWLCETQSVTCSLGLSILNYLSHIVMQRPTSFLCCPQSPSHHPSCLTLDYLIPNLCLLPPPTPFWPFGTYPFFPHAQTISIRSDLLYLLTPSLFELSYTPLHS